MHGGGPLLIWWYVFAPSQFNTTPDPSHRERKTPLAHIGVIFPPQSVGFFSCDSSWWREGPRAKVSVGTTGFQEHTWTCLPECSCWPQREQQDSVSVNWCWASPFPNYGWNISCHYYHPHLQETGSSSICSTFNYNASRRSICSLWLGETNQTRGDLDGLHAVFLKIGITRGARVAQWVNWLVISGLWDEPHVGLHTQRGVCWRFSLPLPLPPTLSLI